MQHILAQPAPQLFNRVEPGSIGGQESQLDGQVILHGCGTRLLRPEGGLLGFKPRQHVRVNLDRPVVLSHINRFGVRIVAADIGIEIGQVVQADAGMLAIGDLAGGRIERADAAKLGVALVAAVSQSLMMPSLVIGASQRRLPPIGDFIQIHPDRGRHSVGGHTRPASGTAASN